MMVTIKVNGEIKKVQVSKRQELLIVEDLNKVI